ncbi:MAG: heparinase II/III family protein [Hyphomonadaceae bacterium]|nr:heparinase II/III family protein [Hyphomonadaceae bacterium]
MARGASPWRPLLNAAVDEWRSTPFYRASRASSPPSRIALFGHDVRVGDARRGREIATGHWRIATERLSGQHLIPWGAAHPSSHFTSRLHSFSWLIDLAALGAEAHPRIAQLLERWQSGFGQWHEAAWAPELTAERLYAWLCHARPAFETKGQARTQLLQSFGWQAHHLMAAWKDLRAPHLRIKTGAALTLAGLAIGDEGERIAEQGVELLEEACSTQFHPDGGHLSRSPEALAEALADLISIDDALARGGFETPRLIRETIPRAAQLLRLLRLGDGGLACFHGGSEGSAASLESILKEAGAGMPAFRFATQSGYQHLSAGDSVVVMDVGGAPPPAHGERAHASALAFELSTGRDRLIVNVGAARELAPDWRAAARATNGHSTLALDDSLSAEFSKPKRGRGAAYPLEFAFSSKRMEEEDGVHIEARHEGYREEFGFVHRRFLFMDKEGRNVRGADELGRPLNDGKSPNLQAIPFAVRFHLHPSVRAEWAAPREPRLITPGGAIWRLRTDATRVAIEDSIYLAGRQDYADKPRQETSQIVLSGAADPNGSGEGPPNRLRWALQRID